jgi:hypothetical protein
MNSTLEVSEIEMSALQQVPDRVLREAAVGLSRSIMAYKELRARGQDESVPAILDICLNAREVFAFYERHQNRFGQTSARTVRPTITNLFASALNELQWTQTRRPTDERVTRVQERLQAKLAVLSSGNPIEPEPVH